MQTSNVFDRGHVQIWRIARWKEITQRLPALAVIAFGLLLLYGVGFSTLPAAHNTTHDTRHATGFPCH